MCSVSKKVQNPVAQVSVGSVESGVVKIHGQLDVEDAVKGGAVVST